MKIQLNLPVKLKEREILKLVENDWEIDKVKQLEINSPFKGLVQFSTYSDYANITIDAESEAIGLSLKLLKPLFGKIEPSKNFFRIFSATKDELLKFCEIISCELPEEDEEKIVMEYVKEHDIPNFELYKKLLMANLRSLNIKKEDFLKQLEKFSIPNYWKEIYRKLLE